jgi:hypothetical protein
VQAYEQFFHIGAAAVAQMLVLCHSKAIDNMSLDVPTRVFELPAEALKNETKIESVSKYNQFLPYA